MNSLRTNKQRKYNWCRRAEPRSKDAIAEQLPDIGYKPTKGSTHLVTLLAEIFGCPEEHVIPE